MSSVKILHIGDMHLDRRLSHLPKDRAEIRKNEILLSFKRILERFSEADVVLISGDVFDGECSDATIEFLCRLFIAHSDKMFFISCGNHDSLDGISTQKFIKAKPDNVIIFSDVIRKYHLKDKNVCVYGVSFSSSYSYTSLINGFTVDDPGCINIMVMHGDLSADSKYNSTSPDDIGRTGLDYLALGHVHTFSGFKKKEKTIYAYPGIFEPGGFDETGECGVIYGELSKESSGLEFYPTSLRKYHILEFDVSNFKFFEEVLEALADTIAEKDCYRIVFTGQRNFWGINIETFKELVNAFYTEFEDHTQNADSIMNYLGELSLKGKTAYYLSNYKHSCDEDVYSLACDIITNLMCRE